MSEPDYNQALRRDGRDLVAAARGDELPSVAFRADEIARLVELLDRGRSVLLTGAGGVGKTAVIHGAAHLIGGRRRDHDSAVRCIIEISTSAILAGTRYLGEWQSKLDAMIRAAIKRRAALFIPDVWNLSDAGSSSSSNSSMLDGLRVHVQRGDLVLVGEASAELNRKIERVPGFASLFEPVPIAPLPDEEVDSILDETAARSDIVLDPESRRTLIRLTRQFSPARPQPGPSLELLSHVRDYRDQKRAVDEPAVVTPSFIERVFSIYSGLPLFVVSPRQTRPARDIRAWFHDRIVGQREAIGAVIESIAIFKSGLRDPSKPIGTFFFVGPTGVGKTEVARALATYLFGSPSRLLRFDLSEFKDYHAFEMLVGNPREPERPAKLLDPVRAQPFQVVLLDELEKAHENVWDLLLPLLDEGRLTPPAGAPVDFRNTIVIATSNVGAAGAERSVGFGAEVDDTMRRARIREALEAEFRPELLNRFQHVVVFHPLSRDDVHAIARQELRAVVRRDGIVQRNLVVELDDAAIELVVDRGYDARYGARALKRELQRQVVLPLAMTLMERELEPGHLLRVTVRDDRVAVRVVDTADSRQARREREPVAVPGEGRRGRDELAEHLEAARERLEALSATVDEAALRTERSRLLELRADPNFWTDAEAAARDLRDLDRLTVVLDRLDRLRGRTDSAVEALREADTRRRLGHVAGQLGELERHVESAWREMVRMGREGEWDALVEIRPVGAEGARAVQLLVETYTRWIQSRRMTVEWLYEPAVDEIDAPAMLAVKGHFPYGFLRLEAGVHRFREGETHGAARVRVVPWTDAVGEVRFADHRALKIGGAFGGRVRSRLACEGGLVLQNGKTLAENRELAAEVAPAWYAAPSLGESEDAVVRRYELDPLRIRDVLTGQTTGRTDALAGAPFHALLCARIDA